MHKFCPCAFYHDVGPEAMVDRFDVILVRAILSLMVSLTERQKVKRNGTLFGVGEEGSRKAAVKEPPNGTVPNAAQVMQKGNPYPHHHLTHAVCFPKPLDKCTNVVYIHNCEVPTTEATCQIRKTARSKCLEMVLRLSGFRIFVCGDNTHNHTNASLHTIFGISSSTAARRCCHLQSSVGFAVSDCDNVAPHPRRDSGWSTRS